MRSLPALLPSPLGSCDLCPGVPARSIHEQGRCRERAFATSTVFSELEHLLDTALAPQRALKPVEGGEDETRQFGVLSKEEPGDCHHFATGRRAHASYYQRDTEEGNCCELTLSAAKDR